MVFLIILHFIFFLLAFGVNLLAIYLLIKHFNRTKDFWSIFKPILLYEFAVFCFFTIKISPLLLHYNYYWGLLLFSLYLLILVVGLFFIFQYIMQKFSLLDLKKSLLIFLLMFIIITPFISFSRTTVEFRVIKNLPTIWDSFNKWQDYEMTQQTLFKPPSIMLLEKIDELNNIFLEGKLLGEIRQYLVILLSLSFPD